jgi:hypothetical protein
MENKTDQPISRKKENPSPMRLRARLRAKARAKNRRELESLHQKIASQKELCDQYKEQIVKLNVILIQELEARVEVSDDAKVT